MTWAAQNIAVQWDRALCNQKTSTPGKTETHGIPTNGSPAFSWYFVLPKQNKYHQHRPKADVPHIISVIPD